MDAPVAADVSTQENYKFACGKNFVHFMSLALEDDGDTLDTNISYLDSNEDGHFSLPLDDGGLPANHDCSSGKHGHMMGMSMDYNEFDVASSTIPSPDFPVPIPTMPLNANCPFSPDGAVIDLGGELDHGCTDDNLYELFTNGMGTDIQTNGRYKSVV